MMAPWFRLTPMVAWRIVAAFLDPTCRRRGAAMTAAPVGIAQLKKQALAGEPARADSPSGFAGARCA
jgi:hypothetical protein